MTLSTAGPVVPRVFARSERPLCPVKGFNVHSVFQNLTFDLENNNKTCRNTGPETCFRLGSRHFEPRVWLSLPVPKAQACFPRLPVSTSRNHCSCHLHRILPTSIQDHAVPLWFAKGNGDFYPPEELDKHRFLSGFWSRFSFLLCSIWAERLVSRVNERANRQAVNFPSTRGFRRRWKKKKALSCGCQLPPVLRSG